MWTVCFLLVALLSAPLRANAQFIGTRAPSTGLLFEYLFLEAQQSSPTNIAQPTAVDSALNLLGPLKLSASAPESASNVGVVLGNTGTTTDTAVSTRSLATLYAGLHNDFTLELWIKLDRSQIGAIIELGAVTPGTTADPGTGSSCQGVDLALYQGTSTFSYYFNTNSGGSYCVGNGANAATGLESAPAMHLVVVRNGGNIQLLINGVSKSVYGDSDPAIRTPAGFVHLGMPNLPSAGGHTWKGLVYMAAMYNRSLSDPTTPSSTGDVLVNFNAWLPNSKPIVNSPLSPIQEDLVQPLVFSATDFDNIAFAGFSAGSYPTGSGYTKPSSLVQQTISYKILSANSNLGPPHAPLGTFYPSAAGGAANAITFPFQVTGTTVYYQPLMYHYGVLDQIVVQAFDGHAWSDPVTLPITVNFVDHAPVATSNSQQAVIGIPTILVLSGVDYDNYGNGNALDPNTTAAIVQMPTTAASKLYQVKPDGSQGAQITGASTASPVTVTDPSYRVMYVSASTSSFTSNVLPVVGTDSFAFTLTDQHRQTSAPGTITVQLTNNLQPNQGLQFGWEDYRTELLLSAKDLDSYTGKYSYTIESLPTKGALYQSSDLSTRLQASDLPITVTGVSASNANVGSVVYVNELLHFGTPFDSLTFRAYRGSSPSASGAWASYVGTLPIAINQTNHPPHIEAPDTLTVDVLSSVSLYVNVTDPDPTPSIFRVVIHVEAQIAFVSLTKQALAFQNPAIHFTVGDGQNRPDQDFLAPLSLVQLALMPLTVQGQVPTSGYINITVYDNDQHYPGPASTWKAVYVTVTNNGGEGSVAAGKAAFIIPTAAVYAIWACVGFGILSCCACLMWRRCISPWRESRFQNTASHDTYAVSL